LQGFHLLLYSPRDLMPVTNFASLNFERRTMNLAWMGFGCAVVGAGVMTLYTVANYRLRHNGAGAVWLGGWILGAIGMTLTGVGWALLSLAGPHYNIPPLRIAGLVAGGLGGFLYFYSAASVGRLRSRARYTLSLHTEGIYRFVRHPQALALCLVAAGAGLATLSRPFLWCLPIWLGFWVAYTFFEERFELIPAYGEVYYRYRETAGRLFPSMTGWKMMFEELTSLLVKRRRVELEIDRLN
jgi:protein-S-isoprenylcysteine O-methyltransferase Ste14